MAAVSFLRSYGDVPMEFAQNLIQFRGLTAEASYHSGATNHESFLRLHDLPAEAEFYSGATNHDTLFTFRDLAGEALYQSGATMHDTQGFPVGSPYVCPEEGTGVITNYLT